MKRKPGFYWVCHPIYGWLVAEWAKHNGELFWFFTGTLNYAKDEELITINETRIPEP